MRTNFFRSALLLFAGWTFAAAEPARALSSFDYLVEPYIGYGILGAASIGSGTYFGSTSSYGSFGGLSLGGRAGIEVLDFLFLALDGNYSPSLFVKQTDAGNALNILASAPVIANSASNTKLGLVAGVRLPLVGLRAWLGYNPWDWLQGTSSTTLNGYSIKVGAGVPVLFVFNLTVEWITSSYSTFTALGGAATSNPGGAISNSQLLLSLSAPLTF